MKRRHLKDVMIAVTTTLDTYILPKQLSLADECGAFQVLDQDIIYTELPTGLIDLPSAARKYDLNRRTIRDWVIKSHLKVYGRLKGSAKGGGFLLLKESELLAYMTAPRNKGGRPRKEPAI